MDVVTGQLVPLFNPRQHAWNEHFTLDGVEIVPLTDVGRVTILVLQLNRPGRIEVREVLRRAGLYP